MELDKVLLIGDGDNVTVGKPIVDGARVMATASENGRDKKIIVFKFKAKVRYRRKNGHRQQFTSLNIEKILPPGAEAEKPKATKPAAAKPKATKPAADKTASTEPQAAKPAAAKVTSTKPRAVKPAATKTRTAKSETAETKPVRKAAPRKKKEETTEDGA